MVLNLTSSKDPRRSSSRRIHAELLPPRRSPLRLWLAGFLVTALASATSIAAHRCGDAEVRALPAAERRLLLERGLELLRLSCRGAAERPAYALDERCRAEAEHLQRFPECQDECHALTDPLTPSAIH